jgi:hypothetical protein
MISGFKLILSHMDRQLCMRKEGRMGGREGGTHPPFLDKGDVSVLPYT